MEPRCAICDRPATCYGSHEGHEPHYSCDNCCGHGCEDGWCTLLSEEFDYEGLIARSAGEREQ